MEEREFQAHRLFKAIGNPLRLAIVKSLGEGGGATPMDLSIKLRRELTNISQHLKILRDGDVACFKPNGKQPLYRLKDPAVLDIIAMAESFALARNLGPRKQRNRNGNSA